MGVGVQEGVREVRSSASARVVVVRSRAGLRILIPGYMQWTWRQRERAAVLFGSFAMALGVGGFAWGSWTGWALLAFAFGTHVASAVDVLRQSAFPGFGRWAPVLSASGGLAFGLYGPTLLVASLVAWPAMDGAAGMDGYLVNFWAFQKQEPRAGDWVWLDRSPWGATHVGQVLAQAGQEVEWSSDHFRVDGAAASPGVGPRMTSAPAELAFVVPAGHLLMRPTTASAVQPSLEELALVPQDHVAGRAWVRMYPLWERRALH